MAEERLYPAFTIGGHLAEWHMELHPSRIGGPPNRAFVKLSAELLIPSDAEWAIMDKQATDALKAGKRVAITLSLID